MDDEIFYGQAPNLGSGATGPEAAHGRQQRVSGRKVSGRKVSGRKVSGRKVSGRKVSGRKVSGRMLAASAAVALAAGGLGAGLGAALSSPGIAAGSSAAETVTVPSATETSKQVLTTAAIAAKVDPAVVDIDTTVTSPTAEGQEGAEGTGMILTRTGEILTNNHVVADATSIKVYVQGRAAPFAAKVIGVDPTDDVALLQIEGLKNPLPTVTLANSSTLSIGSSVVAIGNALGQGGSPTVVTGEVTALGRTITAADDGVVSDTETLHGMIQTDAQIVPGDSGGPLVDAAGDVVGMDTAASSTDATSTEIAFSIPIDEAITLVDRMAKGETGSGIILGETPYLGIFEDGTQSSVSPGSYGYGGYGYGGYGYGGSGASGTTGSTAQVAGVYVSDVSIGGPAFEAGIRGGDTITSLDGTATTTLAKLKTVLDSLKPGAKVTIEFVDPQGSSGTATVVVGAIPE